MFKLGIFVCLLAASVAGNEETNTEQYSFEIHNKGKPACVATAVRTMKYTVSEPEPNLEKYMAYFVTAARCVRGVDVSRLSIRLQEGKDINVSRVIVHPGYRPPNIDYDIAILKAKWESDKSLVKSMPLSERRPTANEALSVLHPAEQKNVTGIEWSECQKKLGGTIRLSSKMLCASVPVQVKDGSALVLTLKEGKDVSIQKLVGVAFFGQENMPRIFTNIAAPEISSFIKKNADLD